MEKNELIQRYVNFSQEYRNLYDNHGLAGVGRGIHLTVEKFKELFPQEDWTMSKTVKDKSSDYLKLTVEVGEVKFFCLIE